MEGETQLRRVDGAGTETLASLRDMRAADIVARFDLIGRFLADDKTLTEQDHEALHEIDWIDMGDAATVEDDPRIITAQQDLANNRHNGHEAHYRLLCKLTEWHVVLESVVAKEESAKIKNTTAA